MNSYSIQYYAAVAVAMLLTGLGLVQVADPADFGLSPVGARWLAVIASMLGVLAGVLPSLRRPPVEHDDTGPAAHPDPQPRDGSTPGEPSEQRFPTVAELASAILDENDRRVREARDARVRSIEAQPHG